MKVIELIKILRTYNVVPRWSEDQLKLVGETRNLPADVIEQVRAYKTQLIEFLIEAAEQDQPIVQVPVADGYPLSAAQRGIWVLSQFEKGNQAYNVTESKYMKGSVDVALMEQAFQLVINKHESLRTVFQVEEGEPQQIILDRLDFSIGYRVVENQDITVALEATRKEFVNWKFDLHKGPLLKIDIVRFGETNCALFLAIHHIICDGWSVGVMIQEAMHHYEQLCKENEILSGTLPIQYKDYAAWQAQKCQNNQAAVAFWKKQNLQDVDAIQLPYDMARPEVLDYKGGISRYYIDPELYKSIQAFTEKKNGTLFNFFKAVWSLALHKITGQEEVVIGAPVAGRVKHELENQIGIYVNTLPLKSSYHSEESFYAFLDRSTLEVISAFQYQDYPLGDIIEQVSAKRDLSRNPLFDVLLVLQNTAISDGSINLKEQHGFTLEDLDEYLYGGKRKKETDIAAKFDLSIEIESDGPGVHRVEIEYASSLFAPDTIDRIYQCFENVLKLVLETPNVLLKNIALLPIEQVPQIDISPVVENHLFELIAPSFEKYADEIAVESDAVKLTYAKLSDEVDRLSQMISNQLQNTTENRVGVLMERTEKLLIAVLAILKSGNTYVPIDLNYPDERVHYIMEDANLVSIIVDDSGETRVGQRLPHVINVDKQMSEAKTAPVVISQYQTAYLIYTSGSTGKPKGVEIMHRNVIAFMHWCVEEFANSGFEVVYAATSHCFDLSVFEMFFPLIMGKKVKMLTSASEIEAALEQDQHVMVNTVPSVVVNMLEGTVKWDSIRVLNMAGEAVPFSFKERLDWKNMEVRNLYGPSEDTTYSTCYRFREDAYNEVPIGKAITGTGLCIFDKEMNPLPVGIEGEICLWGNGLSKGYFGKEELTAEKFIDHPFCEGQKLYKTGDLGKMLSDGTVLFRGRVDDQVKIRGHRIEPGEIAYHLEKQQGVKQAFVRAIDWNGEKTLVAYVVSDKELLKEGLNEELATFLPLYMLPTYYKFLDEIPLNTNGKIDRKKLPLPSFEREVVPPVTEMQKELYELWVEVLGYSDFGIENNFFDLGGHSLKANRLKSLFAARLNKEISLQDLFYHTTIQAQEKLLASAQENVNKLIAKEEKEHYPLSITQERLWVLTGFQDASVAYHMPVAFEVKGKIDLVALENTFQYFVSRHASLRTVFREISGTPVQVVLDALDFSVQQEHLASSVNDQLHEIWSTPFDLQNGPLFRVSVLENADRCVLSMVMHHLISDGWSVGILIQELKQVYTQFAKGETPDLQPLDIQFTDYARWQREQWNEDSISNGMDFWNEVFADGVEPLNLLIAKKRPQVKTYEGALTSVRLSKEQTRKLKEIARETSASLFMVLVSSVNMLLRKYSHQNTITVGMPVSGRNNAQLHNLVGFFVNTLPLVTKLKGEESFESLLHQVKENMLKTFQYEQFPFETLVEELQPQRDISRSPLFDVLVNMQNTEGAEIYQGVSLNEEITLEKVELPQEQTKYDLSFNFLESNEELVLELEYNTDLFEARSIRLLTSSFEELIDNLSLQAAIQNIECISPTEKEGMLNQSFLEPVQQNLFQILAPSFEKYADRIAVQDANRTLTYTELKNASSRIAGAILDQNIRSERIGVMMGRSVDTVIAILGILKAGKTYVPVDINYPEERIQYIIEDAQLSTVLVDSDFEGNAGQDSDVTFVKCEMLVSNRDVEVPSIPFDQNAYLIYTSGSTGKPKGVQISHKNIVSFLSWALQEFAETPYETMFAVTSWCFDLSVFEMFLPILQGKKIRVLNNAIGIPEALQKDENVFVNVVPSVIRELIAQQISFENVVALNMAGEAAPVVFKEVLDYHRMEVRNLYGPSEDTTYSTCYRFSDDEDGIPIGRVITGSQLYIMDQDLNVVPNGVPGEICLSGSSLSKGYFGKEDLTAEKFVDHPYVFGRKLYRTGDIGVISESGLVHFKGRSDDQVKIRGYRIELGDVQHAIEQVEGVHQALVLSPEINGQIDLVGYVVSELTIEVIKEEMKKHIPAYMVPPYIFKLEEFPLTPNGKVDKKALMAMERNVKREVVSARNEIDAKIMEMWKDVLGVQNLGIHDNFFELGGQSLKATRLVAMIQEEFDVRIDLKDLFLEPTIAHLSDYVETLTWMGGESVGDEESEMIF